MGYYTNFSLTVSGGLDENQIAELEDLTNYGFEDCGGNNDFRLYSVKWYDHDENMIEFSKRYPNKLFQLKGEGEESGDLWMTYYKNGKKQVESAKIAFDPFDESKLK